MCDRVISRLSDPLTPPEACLGFLGFDDCNRLDTGDGVSAGRRRHVRFFCLRLPCLSAGETI